MRPALTVRAISSDEPWWERGLRKATQHDGDAVFDGKTEQLRTIACAWGVLLWEEKMNTKRAGLLAATACGALFAGAAFAQSSATGGPLGNLASRPHDGPRLMMYWQLPIDGKQLRPASYGVRLDSAPLRAASLARLPLMDFRMQSQTTTLHLSGVPVVRWNDSSDDPFDSLKGIKEVMTDPSRPGFYVGWTLVTAVVLCASRNVICEKNKSSGGGGYTPPG